MKLAPMTEARAREVCSWTYPSPYAIYDMGPWQHALQQGRVVANAALRAQQMLAVLDEEDALTTCLRLFERDGRWMMGIALRPDLCGLGLGPAVVRLGLEEHQRRSPGQPLWLEVQDWNTRAIGCYERVGFEIVEKAQRETPSGAGVYVVMRFAVQRAG